MTKKDKKAIKRIISSFIVFLCALFLPEGMLKIAVFLIAYIMIGKDVIKKAIRNIRNGQVFDENFLMCIATIGALLTKEYPEAVMVMWLYQIGELFQSYAVGKSRASIAALMDIRPDYANIEKDGKLIQVDPEEIEIGDEIIVKAGEKIPLDGIVLEGSSTLDTSALTGESMPRNIEVSDMAMSGCINQSGLLRIQVTKEFGESTVSKILDLVENASSKKSKSENFITKFARYYTPGVVIAAMLLTFIPPLFTDYSLTYWASRALTFLVISCPCALVISVPLGFFGGIGAASKAGILVKGSNYLEALSNVETIVFDKTGTLTKGNFAVTNIITENMDKEELLMYAAYAESFSNHPISLSLQKAYGKDVKKENIRDIEEIAGHGVRAIVNNKEVLAGNKRFMDQYHIKVKQEEELYGTLVYVAIDKKFAGIILIEDEMKPDSKQAIYDLKHKNKVKQTVMLTGDHTNIASKVGKELGVDQVYAQLLPQDKVTKVEALLEEKRKKATLAFVGDGINDAPVLSRADIGIAMGGLGSDAAIEAADIVIMDDHPSKINTAMHIARGTLRIVKQNIVFALGIKGFFLLLGAFGYATMWEAVFADVGVAVIAILNSMRALNLKD